jgi:hypothetical protein
MRIIGKPVITRNQVKILPIQIRYTVYFLTQATLKVYRQENDLAIL